MWKKIFDVTLCILVCFIIFIIIYTVINFDWNASYPHEALGVTINNPISDFCFLLEFELVSFSLPLLLNVLLLIISMIMKKHH